MNIRVVILTNDVILIGEVNSEAYGDVLILEDAAVVTEKEDGVTSIQEFLPNLSGENRELRIGVRSIMMTFDPRDELARSYNQWRGFDEG